MYIHLISYNKPWRVNNPQGGLFVPNSNHIMVNMIHAKDIVFSYAFQDSSDIVLDHVSLDIAPGEMAVILGMNGCGKSTLCRHFNGLLPLQSGSLTVNGIDASLPENVWAMRRCAGMVFQNPDNQFVSSVIEEDVAFGLENYQVPREEIPARVSQALSLVGLDGFEKRSPHTLSGGQKQRLALAGVLALDPPILILDEVTSMLDPAGRRDVLDHVRKLNAAGKTIVMVTHYVEEALWADTIYLMSHGTIIAHGTPSEILTDTDLLKRSGLIPPFAVRFAEELRSAGMAIPELPLDLANLAAKLNGLR